MVCITWHLLAINLEENHENQAILMQLAPQYLTRVMLCRNVFKKRSIRPRFRFVGISHCRSFLCCLFDKQRKEITVGKYRRSKRGLCSQVLCEYFNPQQGLLSEIVLHVSYYDYYY